MQKEKLNVLGTVCPHLNLSRGVLTARPSSVFVRRYCSCSRQMERSTISAASKGQISLFCQHCHRRTTLGRRQNRFEYVCCRELAVMSSSSYTRVTIIYPGVL